MKIFKKLNTKHILFISIISAVLVFAGVFTLVKNKNTSIDQIEEKTEIASEAQDTEIGEITLDTNVEPVVRDNAQNGFYTNFEHNFEFKYDKLIFDRPIENSSKIFFGDIYNTKKPLITIIIYTDKTNIEIRKKLLDFCLNNEIWDEADGNYKKRVGISEYGCAYESSLRNVMDMEPSWNYVYIVKVNDDKYISIFLRGEVIKNLEEYKNSFLEIYSSFRIIK